MPSRFLRDLPAERVEAIVMARPTEYGGAYGDSEGRGPWGGRWSRDEPRATSGDRASPPAARARAPPRPRPRARRRPARSASSTTRRLTRAGGLQIGAKLRHPSFGVGEVRALAGRGRRHEGHDAVPGASA